MTKNRSLNHIPKTHTVRKTAAEEIFHLVYPGSDKSFRKSRIREIENWLAESGYYGTENLAELAREWQEDCRE